MAAGTPRQPMPRAQDDAFQLQTDPIGRFRLLDEVADAIGGRDRLARSRTGEAPAKSRPIFHPSLSILFVLSTQPVTGGGRSMGRRTKRLPQALRPRPDHTVSW